jgi:hypothetical protein
MTRTIKPASDRRQPKLPNGVADVGPDMRMLGDDQLDVVAGALTYKLDRCFVKSWSTSGDA